MVRFGILFSVLGTLSGLRAARTWVWFPETAQLSSLLQTFRIGGAIPLLLLHAFVVRKWQIYPIVGSVYFLVSILSALQSWVSLCFLNNQFPLLSFPHLLPPLLYLHYFQVCYDIIRPSISDGVFLFFCL